MTIENELYVGVIHGFGVPNEHTSLRFRYAITRKTTPSMLMVAGSAATEQEAANRVQQYLRKFAEHDASKGATSGTWVNGSAIA
jgi:hypothetical protein